MTVLNAAHIPNGRSRQTELRDAESARTRRVIWSALVVCVTVGLTGGFVGCDASDDQAAVSADEYHPGEPAVRADELVTLAVSGDAVSLSETLEDSRPDAVAEAVAQLLVHYDGIEIPMALVDQALEVLGPDHGVLWMHRGLLHLLDQQQGAALSDYRHAVDAANPDLRAYTSLSALHLRAGRIVEAQNAAFLAVEAMPTDSLSLSNLVHALGEMDDIGQAHQRLSNAGVVLPDELQAQLLRAFEQPADVPTVMVDQFPVGARQAFDEAQQRYRRGDLEGAVSYWRRGVRLDPLDEEMVVELGATLSELGRELDALRVYESYASFRPISPLCMNHGNVLLRLSRHDEAVSAYESCLEVLPDWLDPRVNLVSALTISGRLDEAERHLATLQGLGLDPTLSQSLVAQLSQYRAMDVAP